MRTGRRNTSWLFIKRDRGCVYVCVYVCVYFVVLWCCVDVFCVALLCFAALCCILLNYAFLLCCVLFCVAFICLYFSCYNKMVCPCLAKKRRKSKITILLCYARYATLFCWKQNLRFVMENCKDLCASFFFFFGGQGVASQRTCRIRTVVSHKF